MVPVYSKASEESTVIGTLNYGDPVTLKEITNEAFSKIITANNVTGYVASTKLISENPITGTSEFDPFGDATSVTTAEVTLPDGETVQTTGVKKDNIYYPATPTPKPTLESIGTDEFGNPIYPTPTPDPNKPTPTPDPNQPTTAPASPTPADKPTTAPATPTPADNPTEAPKPTDPPTEAPKPPTEAPKPPTEAPKPTTPPDNGGDANNG
jgi:hypothetical protein